MSDQKNYTPINFLTDPENMVMQHLLQAADLFDEICHQEPQDPADTFNFGHYIDAAKSAVILRGARRIDPNVLLKPKMLSATMVPLYHAVEKLSAEVEDAQTAKLNGEDKPRPL